MIISGLGNPVILEYRRPKERPALWKTVLVAALLFSAPVNAASSQCLALRNVSHISATCPLDFAPLDLKHAIENHDVEKIKLFNENWGDLERLGFFDRRRTMREIARDEGFLGEDKESCTKGWLEFHTPLSYALYLAKYNSRAERFARYTEGQFLTALAVVEALLQAGASADTPFDLSSSGTITPIDFMYNNEYPRKYDERTLMLLLEYSARPGDLLPRAIADGRYSIAGKILSLYNPSEHLFQPFAAALVANLKEAGIGVIIETIDGEEFARLKIIGEVIPSEKFERAWEEFHSEENLRWTPDNIRIQECAKVFNDYQKGLRICKEKAKNIGSFI